MQKTIKFLSLVLIMIFLASSAVMAGDAFSKLGRGIENVITSPVEIVNQTLIQSEKNNPVTTIFTAPVTAVVMVVTRVLVGAYDIVTFPIPFPANYEPLIEPATPLDTLNALD